MHPDRLTATWLSGALDAPVRAVLSSPVGTGQVGTCVRCVITYDDGPAGGGGSGGGAGRGPAGRPSSVVVKLPSVDATSRAAGIATQTYVREVGFYRTLQSTVDLATPRCFHVDWDATTSDFAIVLEDLAPAAQGDQLAGCSPDTAATVVRAMTGLHAPWWGDARLAGIEWLSRRSSSQAESLVDLYRAVWPGFADRFGAVLSAEQLALGAWLGENLLAWLAVDRGALTLTHGDFRLDNLLFREHHEPGSPVVVVDWQTVGHGSGGADLSYFLGAGLTTDDRRTHERALVREYHGALQARGVAWSFGDCWTSYRLHALSGVVMSVIASMIVGQTARGDAMFEAMATRHLQHALDLDAGAAVG